MDDWFDGNGLKGATRKSYSCCYRSPVTRETDNSPASVITRYAPHFQCVKHRDTEDMIGRTCLSLCVVAMAITRVIPASISTMCRCSSKMTKCPKMKCSLGSMPVDNPCQGCCQICGKTEGEECGGVDDIYGRCVPTLNCQPGLFAFGKLTKHKGTCSKPFGFDMTGDFMKADDLDTLWDDWHFSFASEVKEVYNVFDLSKDYLKTEDMNNDMWDGWDFSFSSDQQIKYETELDNDYIRKEQTTNSLWMDWPFSFSSENDVESFISDASGEGSGDLDNRIHTVHYPQF